MLAITLVTPFKFKDAEMIKKAASEVKVEVKKEIEVKK